MDSSLSPPVDTPGAQLAFLKNASSDKKVTRDGNPPKRRGPKPDSRPALTRRQELNRQAQRTHRERKELYIKALEDEVLRLKEIYSSIAQDKERLAGENRQLRQLLIQQQQGGTMTDNGGQGPSPGPSSGGGGGGPSSGAGGPGGFGGGLGGPGGPGDDTASNPSAGYSGSANGSYGGPAPSSHTSAYTPPSYGNRSMTSPTGHSPSSSHAAFQSQPPQHMHQHKLHQQPPHVDAPKNPAIDYEQAGIDFVLTLEKPCMDHLPWLVEHSAETGSSVCGHALMASCPPRPFFDLQDNVPFGDSNVKASIVPGTGTPCEPVTFAPGTAPGQRTWELSKADLSTLLALSAKLDLDGEITPVMAWGMILAHPRLGELTLHDFGKLTEELAGKIRCYGFGAVMEEFEVRDALENVLPTKPDALVSAGAGAGAAAFSFNAPVQRPLQGQQHQAMPFITNTFAGDAHNGMPSAHAAFGQLSAPSAMYTPDMIQPGYAVAI